MKRDKKFTKREKLLICAAIATTCAAGYFGYKYFSSVKFEELLNEDNKSLKDSVDTLMAAASEGVFEEAIGTVNHKITYRVDKEKYLVEYLKVHPNENKTRETLDRVRTELFNLYSRKDKIEKAQALYEIKNEM